MDAMSDDSPKTDPSPETKLCPFCAEEIKAAAIKCKHCGEILGVAAPTPQATQPAPPQAHAGTAGCGILLAIVCGLLFLYSFVMDTSVSTGAGQRVHNIGLMQRQNQFMMVGGIGFLAGLFLVAMGRKGQASVTSSVQSVESASAATELGQEMTKSQSFSPRVAGGWVIWFIIFGVALNQLMFGTAQVARRFETVFYVWLGVGLVAGIIQAVTAQKKRSQ